MSTCTPNRNRLKAFPLSLALALSLNHPAVAEETATPATPVPASGVVAPPAPETAPAPAAAPEAVANPAPASAPVTVPETAATPSLEPAPIPTAAPVPVAGPRMVSSIGFEYIKDTSVPGQASSQTNVPIGLSRATDYFIFEVYVPYIRRTAPSGKIASSHHHESREDSAAAAPVVTNEGLGDITASLQFALVNGESAPTSLFAKGEVKLATADVKRGLGTGANDYSIELIARHSAGSYKGEASVGYANLGSPGEVKINDVKRTLYFRNIYFGSLSGAYRVSENLDAGMKLELAQASYGNGPQQRDLSATMEYRLSPKRTLRAELLKSLTPGLSLYGFSTALLTEF